MIFTEKFSNWCKKESEIEAFIIVRIPHGSELMITLPDVASRPIEMPASCIFGKTLFDHMDKIHNIFMLHR